MILDHIGSSRRYACLGERFVDGFAFLRRADIAAVEPGRYPIRGEDVYAMVMKAEGRPRDDGLLEVHQRYADIQYVVAGVDEMGWKPLSACRDAASPFDQEKDAQLFRDKPDAWVATGPGCFAVFFPEDAHLPLVGNGSIHKVVVKVRLPG